MEKLLRKYKSTKDYTKVYPCINRRVRLCLRRRFSPLQYWCNLCFFQGFWKDSGCYDSVKCIGPGHTAFFFSFGLTTLRFPKVPWQHRRNGEYAVSNVMTSTQMGCMCWRRYVRIFALLVLWWPRRPFADSSFNGSVRCRIIFSSHRKSFGGLDPFRFDGHCPLCFHGF